MNLEELKQELIKDPEVKKEFERFDLKMWLEDLWTELKIIFTRKD